MPKVTLEQKRLEALRRQLQGRGEVRDKSSKSHQDAKPTQISWHYDNEIVTKQPETKTSSVSSQMSPAFLKRDLLKILILSALAMSLQLMLYFFVRSNLLNLNFF
jgi:hypothetical protein